MRAPSETVRERGERFGGTLIESRAKMDDSTEELEPLFDYRRVQPTNFICLEDDSDSSPQFAPKRRRTSDSDTGNTKEDKTNGGKTVEVVDCEDEEDWLPPPPKNLELVSKLEEDATIRELRLRKQELTSLAKSTEDALRAVEEAAKKAAATLSHSSPQKATEELPKPLSDRAKIVISIQDKNETKQYRVFADERFEQLFKRYAEKAKIDVHKLVFCFDGDKIDPASTPKSLGMEDDDLIEVHVKPH